MVGGWKIWNCGGERGKSGTITDWGRSWVTVYAGELKERNSNMRGRKINSYSARFPGLEKKNILFNLRFSWQSLFINVCLSSSHFLSLIVVISFSFFLLLPSQEWKLGTERPFICGSPICHLSYISFPSSSSSSSFSSSFFFPFSSSSHYTVPVSTGTLTHFLFLFLLVSSSPFPLFWSSVITIYQIPLGI